MAKKRRHDTIFIVWCNCGMHTILMVVVALSLFLLSGELWGWGGEHRGALGNNCLTRFQPAPGASINRRVAAGTNYMPTFLLTPFAYISSTGTEMTILFPTQILHSLITALIWSDMTEKEWLSWFNLRVDFSRIFRYWKLSGTKHISL